MELEAQNPWAGKKVVDVGKAGVIEVGGGRSDWAAKVLLVTGKDCQHSLYYLFFITGFSKPLLCYILLLSEYYLLCNNDPYIYFN